MHILNFPFLGQLTAKISLTMPTRMKIVYGFAIEVIVMIFTYWFDFTVNRDTTM